MGKFALFIVMAMTFGLIVYGYGLRNNLFFAEQKLVEDYEISHAKNIAQSTAMIVINRIRDLDGDSCDPNGADPAFIPDNDATPCHFPVDGTSFQAWDDLDGQYRVQVISSGDTLFIEVTGKYEDFEYPIEVAVTDNAVWSPIFPYAVFTDSGIDLSGSARIQGHAGTNSSDVNGVNLSWATSIDSTLSIGPGGIIDDVVNQAHSGNVGDEIVTLPDSVHYPLPSFPNFPDITSTAPPLTISAWPVVPPQYFSTFEGQYIPEIHISGNATLTMLTGDQDRSLHVGRLIIQQGHFDIEGDGDVTLYVEEEIVLAGSSDSFDRPGGGEGNTFTYYMGSDEIDFGGSTLFNGGIYAESADITLNGSGGIQGNILSGGDHIFVTGAATALTRTIYAPNAFVELTGSADVYGAIVANEFEASGNARVYYDPDFDTDLPELPLPNADPYPILYWN